MPPKSNEYKLGDTVLGWGTTTFNQFFQSFDPEYEIGESAKNQSGLRDISSMSESRDADTLRDGIMHFASQNKKKHVLQAHIRNYLWSQMERDPNNPSRNRFASTPIALTRNIPSGPSQRKRDEADDETSEADVESITRSLGQASIPAPIQILQKSTPYGQPSAQQPSYPPSHMSDPTRRQPAHRQQGTSLPSIHQLLQDAKETGSGTRTLPSSDQSDRRVQEKQSGTSSRPSTYSAPQDPGSDQNFETFLDDTVYLDRGKNPIPPSPYADRKKAALQDPEYGQFQGGPGQGVETVQYDTPYPLSAKASIPPSPYANNPMPRPELLGSRPEIAPAYAGTTLTTHPTSRNTYREPSQADRGPQSSAYQATQYGSGSNTQGGASGASTSRRRRNFSGSEAQGTQKKQKGKG